MASLAYTDRRRILLACLMLLCTFFLRPCQLNGKKTIKTHASQIFVSPFFRSVVGWVHGLEKVDSDCCRFCLGSVSPFCITMK